MKKPIIILNFKTYSESVGNNAVKLAKICEKVSKKFKGTILISPPHPNIAEISEKVKISILAQSIDPVDSGRHTGSVTAESIKNYALGAFISHSEKKMELEEIKKCIILCKKYKLLSFCFSQDLRWIEKILEFGPNFIVYEPEELIAKFPVSRAKPEIISEVVDLAKEKNRKVKVLCGAGISSKEDVEKALELGTVGVALSSAFVKAKNPKKFLEELTSF